MSDFQALIDEFGAQTQKIGLYLKDAVVASDLDHDDKDMHAVLEGDPDLKAIIAEGKVRFAMIATFTIGDLAFDTRVQDPEQFEADQEFRTLMPSEIEMLQEKMKGRVVDGKLSQDDLLGLFDDDDEEE